MSRLLSDLEPDTREKCTALKVAAGVAGFPILVTSTRRTHAEQARLYAQGRTLPGPVVTNAPAYHSWHETGRAFDVCFLKPGGGVTWSVTWSGPWEALALLAERLGLEWGGHFKHLVDRDHFQNPGGLTLAQAMTQEDERNLA